MLRFDKLKLVTPLNTIVSINEQSFQTIAKDGHIQYYKYKQSKPYSLLIQQNFLHGESVIEFTGKVLLDRYHELIGQDNIRYCIEQINALGICDIDIDRLLQTAEVVKCDVTQDVTSKQLNEIITQTKQSLSNYDKWEVEKYSNGICIRNKVTTEKRKKRLCIYDKGKELELQKHEDFRQSLQDSQTLFNYYNDKVRFELNIGTKAQIRELLQIPDNSLCNVLSSTANPILSIIDEATRRTTESRQPSTFKDYVNGLILADNHNNLAELEARIRALTPKGTVIKRKMQPYKDFILRNNDAPAFDLHSLFT